MLKFKSAKLSKEILFKNNSVLQELIRKECKKMRSFAFRVNNLELQCLTRSQGKDMDQHMVSPCHGDQTSTDRFWSDEKESGEK